MTTLTQCQQQVLDMLISYQKERGFPPTNQEVATMLGYRSVNAAVEHLRALEKKGVITIKRGVARGITLHTAVKDDDSEAVGIIRALLAGQLLNFHSHIGAQRIETEIRAVATCDIAAMSNRIHANNHRGSRFLS